MFTVLFFVLREIMFHVSTLLPFSNGDSQQVIMYVTVPSRGFPPDTISVTPRLLSCKSVTEENQRTFLFIFSPPPPPPPALQSGQSRNSTKFPNFSLWNVDWKTKLVLPPERGHVATAQKITHQWCLTLTPNNTGTIERMTCHCFLQPIRRDLTSSSYTTAWKFCQVLFRWWHQRILSTFQKLELQNMISHSDRKGGRSVDSPDKLYNYKLSSK